MKAQLRLAGGRRKLGRNGLSSDRPRGCLPPRISARPARPVFLGSPSPQDAQPTRCSRLCTVITVQQRAGATSSLNSATGEPPGRSEASRTNLPECQQPPVKACSKDAPDPQPMRGGRCMWRPHLFCLGSRLDARWQEAWHRHDNKSCERCSSRASSPHFSRSDDTAATCFFLVVGQWLQR